MKPKSKILIIAGSDSSGGAGIQADIKTVTSLGSYAMTAVTAITAQNTTGVKSIISINPKEISNQIEYTAKDIKPDAIKIGMLHSVSVINAVIKSLHKIKNKKIILDPVMVAKGGARLIDNNSIKILRGIYEHDESDTGGPFVVYMIDIKDSKEVILINGFVNHPGHKKLLLLKEIEIMFQTIYYGDKI